MSKDMWLSLDIPQNKPPLMYLEIKPFVTFVQPFATCGEWRMVWTKAMHLPEIFGLSTFPVFWYCPTFDGRNMSGILTLVSNVQKFRKTYQKFSRNSSSKPLSKNNQGSKPLSENNRSSKPLSKNSGLNSLFLHLVLSKHKKPFILSPERARTVLNAFLECMYMTDVAHMTDVSCMTFMIEATVTSCIPSQMIQKYAQNRSSMLRGQEKQLFVFWPLFLVVSGHI